MFYFGRWHQIFEKKPLIKDIRLSKSKCSGTSVLTSCCSRLNQWWHFRKYCTGDIRVLANCKTLSTFDGSECDGFTGNKFFNVIFSSYELHHLPLTIRNTWYLQVTKKLSSEPYRAVISIFGETAEQRMISFGSFMISEWFTTAREVIELGSIIKKKLPRLLSIYEQLWIYSHPKTSTRDLLVTHIHSPDQTSYLAVGGPKPIGNRPFHPWFAHGPFLVRYRQ